MRTKLLKTHQQIKLESMLRKALINKKIKDKLSDKELAYKLGVSETRLKCLIYDDIDPKLNTLFKLISGLGLKLTIL